MAGSPSPVPEPAPADPAPPGALRDPGERDPEALRAPPHDLPFLIAAGIALAAALVLVRNLIPVKQDLADVTRREENLEREIEALKRKRDLLDLEEKALRDDDAYKERVLRGQTGMSRPGEVLVR